MGRLPGVAIARQNPAAAIGALAILAFNLADGAALAMLDDPMSALLTGAFVGMLWQLRQIVVGGRWRDPYVGADVQRRAPPAIERHAHAGRDQPRLR